MLLFRFDSFWIKGSGLEFTRSSTSVPAFSLFLDSWDQWQKTNLDPLAPSSPAHLIRPLQSPIKSFQIILQKVCCPDPRIFQTGIIFGMFARSGGASIFCVRMYIKPPVNISKISFFSNNTRKMLILDAEKPSGDDVSNSISKKEHRRAQVRKAQM